MVLGERVGRRLKGIFQKIAERYGFEFDTKEVLAKGVIYYRTEQAHKMRKP